MGFLKCVMTGTLCSVPAPWPGNLLRAASELNRNGLCPGKQQYDTTQFLKGEEMAIPASVSFGMAQYQRRESKSLWPGLWHCVKWPEDIDSWASHCRGSGKLDIEVVAAALSPETFLSCLLAQCPVTLAHGNTGAGF